MNILIIEDDKRVASFLERGLKAEGYRVATLHDGEHALPFIRQYRPDVIVLDRMLPHLDGMEICQRIRAKGIDTRVLMLSALSEVEERIAGLRVGADDYLGKPFHFEELLARVGALGKRGAGPGTDILQVGDLSFARDSMQVRRGDRVIRLTAKELGILELLMAAPGKVFSRERILASVWGVHEDPLTNVVDVYMGRLRKKIDEGQSLRLLQTLRGIGYFISADAA
ncbi:response regulator transcription factor [Stutzerimonas tarimensis]|uniref:Response regulator transcription factor n=1 Tax=Stutzerimonas tarimensis TaxID=1507735 RepID=A0ABV7T7U4_9GAMM